MKKYIWLIIALLFSLSSFKFTKLNEKLPVDDTLGLRYAADAEHYLNREMLDSAMVYFRVAELKGISTPYFFYLKGLTEYKKNDFQKAIIDMTNSQYRLPKKQISFAGFQSDLIYLKTDIGYVTMFAFTSLEHRETDIYYYRGLAKYKLKDYFGAVDDLKNYHKTSNDSSFFSCLILGHSLIRIEQISKAKIYFNYIIKNREKADMSLNILGNAYNYRGSINNYQKNKEQACQDWSKANELGNKNALNNIQENCNRK